MEPIWLFLIMSAIGIALGFRYKTNVLFVAMFIAGLLLGILAYRNHTVWQIAAVIVIAITALELGYFQGANLRDWSERRGTPKRT